MHLHWKQQSSAGIRNGQFCPFNFQGWQKLRQRFAVVNIMCQKFGLDPFLFSIGMLRQLVMTFLCSVIIHLKKKKQPKIQTVSELLWAGWSQAEILLLYLNLYPFGDFILWRGISCFSTCCMLIKLWIDFFALNFQQSVLVKIIFLLSLLLPLSPSPLAMMKWHWAWPRKKGEVLKCTCALWPSWKLI